MKKVLLGINTIGYGGVPKSLMNFISNMNDVCEIDLMLFREDGEIHDQLPKDVNIVLPQGYMDIFVENRKSCKKLGFKKYFLRNLMSLWTKIFKSNNLFVNFAVKHTKKLTKHYDVAICFNGVMPKNNHWRGVAEYILKKVDAEKKYVVTHDDYVPEYYKKNSIQIYNQYDKIFAVSKSCCDMIASNVPELQEKLDYCYNFCDVDEIKAKINVKVENLKGDFKIVSATSLISRKGIMLAVKAVKRLRDEGYNINYYIIGTGSEEKNIREYIEENNLAKYVKLLGYKSNPFAYAKQAELFILTSFREAAPMVYAEAFLSGTPVLSTNTASAVELVSEYGYVCEISEEGVYNSLKHIVNNREELSDKKESLKNYRYPNDKIKAKWLGFM